MSDDTMDNYSASADQGDKPSTPSDKIERKRRLVEAAKEFRKNQRIVVYGETHTDNSSNAAAELLEGLGFRKVSDFDGGVHAWKQAGFLTEGLTN
mgnify:CR=1 FL=1